MRPLRLLVALALVVAACGGGAADPPTADTEDTETPQAQQEGDGGGQASRPDQLDIGDDFCRQALEAVAAFIGGSDIEDALDAMEEFQRIAPPELADDLELLLEANRALIEGGDFAGLDEDEVDAAGDRVDAYLAERCPGLFDDGDDVEYDDEFEEATPGPGDDNRATLTVTAGGETVTEELSGVIGVSCILYGSLEDGSIDVYLSGTQFEASVTSFESGVTPGSYTGRIWVFSQDPNVDEALYGLQEIDGSFILDEAYEVSPGDDIAPPLWFFSGSFSLTASEDFPEASVEATYECVGAGE